MGDVFSTTRIVPKERMIEPETCSDLEQYIPVVTITGARNPDNIQEAVSIQAFQNWVRLCGSVHTQFQGMLFISDRSGSVLSLAVLKAGQEQNSCKASLPSSLEDEAMLLSNMTVQTKTFQQTSNMTSVPIVNANGAVIAILAAVSSREQRIAILTQTTSFFSTFLMHELEKDYNSKLEDLLLLKEEEKHKRELLFYSIQRLHSFIDVKMILLEVVTQIQEMFPYASIDLLLSHDESSSGIPVKLMNIFDVNNPLCMRAFIEGKTISGKGEDGKFSEIAAPLSGKQGVYGVLYLYMADKSSCFTVSDESFIDLITAAAGSAFENGKLYEQSNLMVNELRIINELTKRLNQSLKPSEIFQYGMSELLTIFSAEYCCILQTTPSGDELIIQACNVPDMQGELMPVDEGFAGIVLRTKEPVIISDYENQSLTTSRLMGLTGCRSLLASPIFVHGEVVGVILIAHRYAHYFTYNNYKLLSVLSGPIGLALSNASLHAEVRRMVVTDNLTGLYTRRYLDEQVLLHQTSDRCGSLVVVDIDDFKKVNDTLGHQTGDKILIQVSEIMKGSIRDTDIAARWGGEELAVYLPHVEIEQARVIAERIRQRVYNETNPPVSVSCGISDWHDFDEKVGVDPLFYRSDMALYMAKRSGKNQIGIG